MSKIVELGRTDKESGGLAFKMASLTNLGFAGFLSSFGCYWTLRFKQVTQNSLLLIPSEVNGPLLIVQLLALAAISRSKDRAIVTFTGFFLGLCVLVGLLNSHLSFGIYLAVLAAFHFSEFAITGLTNPQNLSFDSYLVNHSKAYGIAAVASWCEHIVTLYMFPELKSKSYITMTGLAICIAGEILRKGAMFQAGRNFNHLVQDTKAKDHVLVTSGVYSLSRHPSYVGWFLWSVGSQLILINPLCLVGYTVVTYLFFRERIEVEEYTLVSFFGQEYRDYQKRVGTGLPWITGYKSAE